MGKFAVFFFFSPLSLAIPQFGLLSHVSSPRLFSWYSGWVLILSMQTAPPCSGPARWWLTQESGLLLRWELWLGAYSVFFVFPPTYVALWDSKTPQRSAGERASWYLETSPSQFPLGWVSSLILFSLFLSFIFCPTSFLREWGSFLGAWCPLPVFRNCFEEVAQYSNDLLMNFW